MKKFFIWSIVVALCFVSVSLASADTTSGLFTYKLKGNGNAVITGFDWASNNRNDIYIPRQIDGYTVSEIAPYAFSSQTETTTYGKHLGQSVVVVIPDTVTMIGEKAFFCTNINTISIPASVDYIGPAAFAGCINIKEHYVQAGNNTYATIDGYLFNKKEKKLISAPAGKEYNTTISIPEGIVSIGPYAFYGITATLKGNKNGSSSSKLISFPESLRKIEEYAFAYATLDCGAFKAGNWSGGSISFDRDYDTDWSFANIEEIGDYAFYSVEMQNCIFEFNNGSLRKIGAYAFSHFRHKGIVASMTNNGKSVTMPSTLEEIGEGAFESFSGRIDSFDMINSKLEMIPDMAFSSCDLYSIHLPSSIKSIGNNAFANIHSPSNGTIYERSSVEITIPSELRIIGDNAFSRSNLSIKIANAKKLEAIGERAFYASMWWPNDTVISIPDGVQTIGSEAFDMYGDFTLSIPSTVTQIGDNVTDRTRHKIQVVPGSYAAVYASENGYLTVGDEDTSWLNN